MRLQVVSDLHLERHDCDRSHQDFDVEAPHLALLGDIGDPFSTRYASFVAKQAARFDTVLIVLGNHEFYHNRESALNKARALAATMPNVHVLEKDSVVVEGVRVLGTTLWSDMDRDCSFFISDFRCIPGWSYESNQAEHAACVKWLRGQLAVDVPTVVLTHHAPLCGVSSHPRFRGCPCSSAFSSDLSSLLGPPVLAWFHGHTHHSYSTVRNGVLVASNAAGYSGEDTGYEVGKAFDVDPPV